MRYEKIIKLAIANDASENRVPIKQLIKKTKTKERVDASALKDAIKQSSKSYKHPTESRSQDFIAAASEPRISGAFVTGLEPKFQTDSLPEMVNENSKRSRSPAV